MAIFLSRIKRALNLGTKTITSNGTYNASSDGYDGYSSVEVNVSGGSATPITPSNANPVALSSGVAVEPTTNGYAIQSYDNITPPSTPQAISSGDILKMNGNGYVIDSYSTATPSDSNPPELSQYGLYALTGNGYLYENQQGGSTETVLWTNQSPSSSFAAQTVSLSGNISDYEYIAIDYCYGKDYQNITSREIYTVNDFIKAKKDSGALHTIGGLTIEDNVNVSYSRPVFYINDTSVAFGVCSKLNGSGTYATASVPLKIVGISVALPPSVGNVKTGVITGSSGTITINCGFKPKKIFVYNYFSANKYVSATYDEDVDSTYQYMGYRSSSSSSSVAKYEIGNSASGTIQSITSTGFTYKADSTINPLYYVAIG